MNMSDIFLNIPLEPTTEQQAEFLSEINNTNYYDELERLIQAEYSRTPIMNEYGDWE
jgi:hypothetical protein